MMKPLLCLLLPLLGFAQSYVDYVTQIKRPPALDARTYQFTRTNGTNVTGSLSVVGAKTVTVTRCPAGLNGTDANHYIRISGGTGTAEAVLITGGTCTSGAASGTLQFTTSNTHTGAWTLTSASGGIVEALWALPATGGMVQMPCGTVSLYQTLVIGNATPTAQSTRQNMRAMGCASASGPDVTIPTGGGTTLTWAGPAGGTMVKVMGPVGNGEFSNVFMDGAGGALIGLDIVHSYKFNYRNVTIADWTSIGLRSMAVDYNFVAMATGNNSNLFENVHVWSQYGTSAAVAAQFGQATFNLVSIFDFASNMILNSSFRHDLGTAIELRFADANTFVMVGAYGANSVKFLQATGNTGFPGSNTFMNSHFAGTMSCSPGSWTIPGAKNMFWPLGEEASINIYDISRCAAGVTHNGRFFGRLRNAPLYYSGILDQDGGDTIASTTTQTAFAKTYEIPADQIDYLGTQVRVKASGRYSTTGTPALTFRVKLGAITYATYAFTGGSSVTNDTFSIDSSISIMQTGAAACPGPPPQSSCGLALVGPGVGYVGGFSGDIGARASSTTGYQGINTTIDQTVTLTAQWGAASASNTVTLDTFTVELLYPGATEVQ